MSTSVPTDESVRPERLAGSRDVRHVLRDGTRRSGRQVAVHVVVDRASVPSSPPRIAVVASRRIGNAVARNRAKRLLREAARRIAWVAGAQVVLVARPGIDGADLWRVLDELTPLATEWSA